MRPPARTTRCVRPTDDDDEFEDINAPDAFKPFVDPPRHLAASKTTGTQLSKSKKPRHRMTDRQLEQLEILYQQKSHPSRQAKQELATDVGMLVLPL